MFLFFLACFVSGDMEEDRVTLELDRINLSMCATGESSHPYKSSLKLATLSEGQEVSHGSGNYFKLGDKRFIVTAAHVVLSEGDVVVSDGYEYVATRLLYLDTDKDIAIIKPGKDLSHPARPTSAS